MSTATKIVVVGVLVTLVDAQFFFNQPFNFFNPQPQFQRPAFQLFQPQTTPPPQTTTTEFIPDPDKEQGNFPMPNPANWPVGPDWNDPRNTNEQQLGWGGTTSTKAPSVIVTRPPTTTSTTRKPIPAAPKKQPQQNRKRSSTRRPVPTASIRPKLPAKRPAKPTNFRRLSAAKKVTKL